MKTYSNTYAIILDPPRFATWSSYTMNPSSALTFTTPELAEQHARKYGGFVVGICTEHGDFGTTVMSFYHKKSPHEEGKVTKETNE